jgi:hypothetical protein
MWSEVELIFINVAAHPPKRRKKGGKREEISCRMMS